MKETFISLGLGFIFAIGLGVSGMTQPTKVVGFLDVFGSWDPSLMFVMIGAIGVHFLSYRLIRKRSSPMAGDQWHIPTRRDINGPLLLGAFIFGVGWGLGGYCPGPAVTALASFDSRPALFVVSMILGMLIFRRVGKPLGLSS